MGLLAHGLPLRAARLLAALAVVAACAVDTVAAGAVAAPDLPSLGRSKERSITIPFTLPKPQDPDGDAVAERVVLEVSKDLGVTWEPAGETAPSTGSFAYVAEADGEYWFRLRAIDRRGRVRGGAGPDMRVLVDAAGPRLAARVWKGPDGEIVCRYAAADDSIDLRALRVEYRVPGQPQWKAVAAQGVLVREHPAHLVGEEIWWAGERVEKLSVQITVTDSSGNRTMRQFGLEPADPGVDQAALAAEVGMAPLPTAVAEDDSLPAISPSPGQRADRPRSTVPGSAAAPSSAGAPDGWSAESGTWHAGNATGTTDATRPRSVLVKRPAADAAAGIVPRPTTGAPEAAPPLPTTEAGGVPLEYRGRPLTLSRSRRFTWDYEVPTEAGAAVRVELWSTRDGGVTWQRSAADDDGRSPIEVDLPVAGLYGFRLEAAGPGTGPGPRSGDTPDAWVGIDEEPPHVDLLGATHLDDGALAIRYTSRDELPVPNGARLLYSPHADGPWATIVADADGQGEHRWQPDRAVPARVFLRVEVRDAAGNVGSATSAEPVTVAPERTLGRLGGLQPLPADESR